MASELPPSSGENWSGGSGSQFLQSLLGNLLKLVNNKNPLQLDLLRQLAYSIATDGEEEVNTDPLERIHWEQLAHLAELHVSQLTGLPGYPHGLEVVTVTRSEWAWRTIEAWKELFEVMATSLLNTGIKQPDELSDSLSSFPVELSGEDYLTGADQLSFIASQWMTAMAPALVSLQLGSAIGYLAREAMGQYDLLPIPRPNRGELVVVTNNVHSFAEQWSLRLEDVMLWVCLTETTFETILAKDFVRAELNDLIRSYVGAFKIEKVNPEIFGDLSNYDFTDMDSMATAIEDPVAFLDKIETEEQRQVRRKLNTVVAVMQAYVADIAEQAGEKLIGAYTPISEASRRSRMERGVLSRMAERIFGMDLSIEMTTKAAAFIRGVKDRDGEEMLIRLWSEPGHLPTPAELEAPGLWLERIRLDN